MPSLGADMDSGTLLEWLARPGDTIHKGQIVAVVDTAKAAVEIECFDDGVLDHIAVQPGQTVPVGTVLATIVPAAAASPRPAAQAPPTPLPTPPAAAPVAPPPVRRLARERHVDLGTVHGTGPGGRITHGDVERAAAAQPVQRPTQPTRARAAAPAGAQRPRVAPAARRLAEEIGVDLTTLRPGGPDGVIHLADVRRAAAARPAPAVETQPSLAAEPPAARDHDTSTQTQTTAMRMAIAALMARSKREIPHYYLADTVDLGPALAWLRERNRHLPVPDRLVPAALLLKAAAVAARAVPELNGFWTDNRFTPGRGIHVGVAVSLRGGGLTAPAIHDAADLDLATLMARLRDLVARARAGRLRGSELADPTITVSNMGERGSESIFGVIYPPQVALVGFGRIVDRPWAVDGLLGVRPVVTVSLAADHRATDGAAGARYLDHLARLLHRPEEL